MTPAVGMDHVLPPGLDWLRGSPEGRRWLERVPRLLEECADMWGLRLEDPFPYAYTSLAVPGTAEDGTGVVVKIQFPSRESEHEAAALELWDGDGAVRLLAHDPPRHALLLERCQPGTPLSELDAGEALDVAVGLLPRLWKPAGAPFRPLAEEAQWWRGGLEEEWIHAARPFERRLLDAALEALDALSSSQGEQVLLHQDLHAGNVLRARREPWLVIDPKPLLGEREFAIAALVRGRELGGDHRAVLYRLDRLTAELGLDRERARNWAMGQTVAWAFDAGTAEEHHVRVARWLLHG